MKHIWLSFLLIFAALATQAGTVDSTTARNVASTFLSSRGVPASAENLILVRTVLNDDLGVAALYMFNNPSGGYVIVSGSDCSAPIIAYSFDSQIDSRSMPPAFAGYIAEQARAISYVQNNAILPTEKIRQQWQSLSDATTVLAPKPTNPFLLESRWDQFWPFNMFCPVFDDEPAPVGCVATALSQIMRFWSHPAQGHGSITYYCQECATRISLNFDTAYYDWENMPFDLYYNDNEVEQYAVAKLCYHVGVSVRMQYKPTSSGVGMTSVGNYAYNALTKYFSYDTNASVVYRSSYLGDDTAWCSFIKSEIDAGRPVFYCGYDNNSSGTDAGHAFVCDGFDSYTGYFHFNWGWGGSYNGWCNLRTSDLNAGGYHFSSLQVVVAGIQPAIPDTSSSDTTSERITIIDDSQSPITIAPNPTNGTSSFNYSAKEPTSAYILSMSGKTLATIPIETGDNRRTLNLSDYPAGVYFIRIGSNVKKVVKL